MSGCSGIGFDLNQSAIVAASANAAQEILSNRLQYVEADGYSFSPPHIPTHVVLGAALRFFTDPEKMLARALSWFGDHGFVLAAEFSAEGYDDHFFKIRREVFGVSGLPPTSAQVLEFYEGLEIFFQNKFRPTIETEAQVEHYCRSTTKRFCLERGLNDFDVAEAVYERLIQIKQMTNALRAKQTCHTFVFRFVRKDYPARYVELF